MSLVPMAARPTAARDFRRSVIYQVYPRSFCDSNGDGIGDLPGVASRLDHLAQLGVDWVWLSPVYASPNDDNGYDISDYRAILPEFGTMADFDALLAAIHARGMRLMMDLVVNHTSDEHPWFAAARQDRASPFHDYYIWREPGPDGGPPTNWEAAFQGSVWEWNEPTGEYYLHMFSRKQPDLNWENPRVRQEVHDLMRFWLDKGVDGFRMDVINMISKPWRADGSLPDAPVVGPGFLQPSFPMTCNGPRLLEFLREMRREVLDHYDTLTVGEAPLATVEVARAITDPATGALDMLFQFEHMDLDSVGGHINGKWAARPMDLREMKATMGRWQDALHGGGWNSLYLGNHDQPRQVSRFADDSPAWRELSAKMLATWLHGHQGSPYVYQGDELGLPNVAFDRIEDYRDIESLNFFRVATTGRGMSPGEALRAIHRKGRDNARTPMPWDGGPNAGFSAGEPWLRMSPRAGECRADQARAREDSVFHHYRRLIALRRELPALSDGRYEQWLPGDPHVDAYTRTTPGQRLLVACNFTGQPRTWTVPPALQALPAHVLLSNYREGTAAPGRLRAWEAVIYALG